MRGTGSIILKLHLHDGLLLHVEAKDIASYRADPQAGSVITLKDNQLFFVSDPSYEISKAICDDDAE